MRDSTTGFLDTSFLNNGIFFEQKTFGNITIIPKQAADKSKYYFVTFESKNAAELFSQQIFDLGIMNSEGKPYPTNYLNDGIHSSVMLLEADVKMLHEFLIKQNFSYGKVVTDPAAATQARTIESVINSDPTYLYIRNDNASRDMAQDLQPIFGAVGPKLNLSTPVVPSLLNELCTINAIKTISIANNGVNININVNSFVPAMQDVQLYYDLNKVSQQEVADIIKLRSGAVVPSPTAETAEEYALRLESLSPYVVMRGKVTQYRDANGIVITPPLELVSYYNTFPKLTRDYHTHIPPYDFKYFCSYPATVKGKPYKNGHLRVDRIDELKQKFKDSIRLLVHVAHLNNEAVDILTPNAFFDGLLDYEKIKAQNLFQKAILEVAQEPGHENCKGIFTHFQIDPSYTSAVPVVRNTGDNTSPQKAASASGIATKVAVLVMGEGVRAVGGGAAAPGKALAAAEERLTRTSLWGTKIFCPAFNNRLLDQSQYRAVDITPIKPRQAPAPSSYFSNAIDSMESYLINGEGSLTAEQRRLLQTVVVPGVITPATRGVLSSAASVITYPVKSCISGISTVLSYVFYPVQKVKELILG